VRTYTSTHREAFVFSFVYVPDGRLPGLFLLLNAYATCLFTFKRLPMSVRPRVRYSSFYDYHALIYHALINVALFPLNFVFDFTSVVLRTAAGAFGGLISALKRARRQQQYDELPSDSNDSEEKSFWVATWEYIRAAFSQRRYVESSSNTTQLCTH
jgi:hypothetical protein